MRKEKNRDREEGNMFNCLKLSLILECSFFFFLLYVILKSLTSTCQVTISVLQDKLFKSILKIFIFSVKFL